MLPKGASTNVASMAMQQLWTPCQPQKWLNAVEIGSVDFMCLCRPDGGALQKARYHHKIYSFCYIFNFMVV